MNEKLKTCPFCGGNPEIRQLKENRAVIGCSTCFYYFPQFRADVLDQKDNAIKAWNERQAEKGFLEYQTLFLWEAGELSEGQAMKRLNLDRVSLRVLREEYLKVSAE